MSGDLHHFNDFESDCYMTLESFMNNISNYNYNEIFIIGGSEIIDLTIEIIQEFYLTRIYGNYKCEKFLNIALIENNMKMIKKIDGDKSCHFEIWRR